MLYSRKEQHRNYPLRLMASLAIALLLVIVCFKLPIQKKPRRPVSWRLSAQPRMEGFDLTEIQAPATASITTYFNDQAVNDPVVGNAPIEAEEKLELEADSSTEHLIPPFLTQKLPVLDFAEIMPAITGGLGAYYIQLEYPEEAIEQGIQGRLVLTFTVNANGSTSDVKVTSPLHPLCDSVAVQALRRTNFIPGQHNGRSVRVRMRLPVRFQLIDGVDSTLSSPPTALSSENAPQESPKKPSKH